MIKNHFRLLEYLLPFILVVVAGCQSPSALYIASGDSTFARKQYDDAITFYSKAI